MTPFRDVQKLEIVRNVDYIKNQTYYLLDPAGVVIGLEKYNMERFHMNQIFDWSGSRGRPRPEMQLFFKEPGVPLRIEDILGKPIYDFIQGVPFANIHKKLLQLATRTFPIRFLWYSDSSTLERQMHTTISCIHHHGGDSYSILYAVEIVYERRLEHVQDYLDFPINDGTKAGEAVDALKGKQGYQSYKDTGDDIWLVAKMWKKEKDKITIQNIDYKVVYDICNLCRDEWDFFFTQVGRCQGTAAVTGPGGRGPGPGAEGKSVSPAGTSASAGCGSGGMCGVASHILGLDDAGMTASDEGTTALDDGFK
ncbi:hypothetical protein HK102_005791 [Quaeritorhiza haematococci]|nr:hypothetical protein HK102_005791 [Quaeritorhiza haematococci]